MNTSTLSWALGIALMLSNTTVVSGVLDPDCNVEKAAKSSAMKATVGVGGRCSPKEAATDMSKDAVGIEDKGPVEKRRDDDDDGAARKATKAIRH
jgi:hypothetical protein